MFRFVRCSTLAVVALFISFHTPAALGQKPSRGVKAVGGVSPAPAAGADASARKAWLAKRIDALIKDSKRLRRARIGILVKDLKTGDVLYGKDANGSYNVASNVKIVTTAAALALLGPGYSYRTSFMTKKREAGGIIDELYVRGRGDPSIGTAELLEMVERLRLRGVREIKGGITIDDTYFDDVVSPPHFAEKPKVQAAWRAPVSALSLNYNAVVVSIRAKKEDSGKPTIRVFPRNSYVRIVNKVDVVTSGRTNVRVDVKTRAKFMELKFSGRMRKNQPQRYKYRIASPRHYFGTALRRMLVKRGIKVGRRELRARKLRGRLKTLVLRKSPAMAELLRGLGKYSNNYVAEVALKTIGARKKEGRGSATWNDGLRAVRGYLVKTVGLKASAFRYGNGSGLFNSNRFTPRQLVKVLTTAHGDFRYGPDLAASMATAGIDGTLRKRMRRTTATGRVRAKTGTLAKASALSGYAGKTSQHQLAFAIVINDMHHGLRTKRDARLLQDHIAQALVAYLPGN